MSLKLVVDAICVGSIMRKPFFMSMQLLHEVSNNNMDLQTRYAQVVKIGYTLSFQMYQDMKHMRTQIDFLTKHLDAKFENVNALGQQNKYEDHDIYLDEKVNYQGNKRGFQNYNSGNQGYNAGNAYQVNARTINETGKTVWVQE